MNVFISYRRDDSGVAARLLYSELVARLGAASVFMDIDDIGYGDDFAAVIDAHLARADVVLVVIGPTWHQVIEQRLRGDDWVRHEVAQALLRRRAGQSRVLPVLLDGVAWPGAALPADIAELQKLSALKLHKADLKAHLNAVLEAVQHQTFEQRAQAQGRLLAAGWKARLAALGLGGALFLGAWFSVFDLIGLDTWAGAQLVPLAGVAAPARHTVLVTIDEATVRAVGRDFDASWRREHAQLVLRALAAGARVLAFDVAMPRAAPQPEADAVLAQAMATARPRMPVVLGVQTLRQGGPELAPALAPHAAWGLACAGKRLGRATVMPLAVLPLLPSQGMDTAALAAVRPSLALAAFSGGGAVEGLDLPGQLLQVRVPAQQRSPFVPYHALERVAVPQAECAAVQPGERVATQWVDPVALRDVRTAVPRVAYERVLAGEAAALAALAGRVVVVGVLLGQADRFGLAGPGGQLAFGSELIAQQVEDMEQGRTVRPLRALGLLLWCFTAAAAGVALALLGRTWPAGRRRAVLVLLLLALAGAAWVALRWERRLVLPHYPMAAAALGFWATRRLLAPAPSAGLQQPAQLGSMPT